MKISMYWSRQLAGRLRCHQSHAPPFDDVKVRQALNYAVDKEAIIQAVLYGKAQVAHRRCRGCASGMMRLSLTPTTRRWT